MVLMSQTHLAGQLESRQLQENLPNCDLNLQLMTLVSFSYLGCDIDNN
jgi:hypothetical protein